MDARSGLWHSLKRFAQRLLPLRLYRGSKEFLYAFRLHALEDRIARVDMHLARLRHSDSQIAAPPSSWKLQDEELSIRSQNGEDGILLFLLGTQPSLTRRIIEIGSADGQECNSANLILNWGWSATLIDGDESEISLARDFYGERRDDDIDIIHAFVTRENVNELAPSNLEADILSIDIDGNDYWIWEAIEITPPIVIIEYNASLGADESVTVPYDSDFRRFESHASGIYHGASLLALTSLAARRGYSLVGCDSRGVNAFYVRDDRLGDIPVVTPAEAWLPHANRLRSWPQDEQQNIAASIGPLVQIPR